MSVECKSAAEQIVVMISDSVSLSFKYNSLETALKEGEPQLVRTTGTRASYVQTLKIKVAKSVTPGISHKHKLF